MPAGVVVPEFGRDRETFQSIEVRALEIRGPLPHPLLQHDVLAGDLAVQVPGLEQISDPEQDLVHLERLGHEVLRALGERAAAGLLGRVAGQHQHRQIALRLDDLGQTLQHRDAVEHRHVQVEEHQVGLLLGEESQDLVGSVVDTMLV